MSSGSTSSKIAGVVGVFLIVAGLLSGGIYMVFRATNSKSHEAGSAIAKCDAQAAKGYTVTIQENKVSPVHTEARLCGRLTIINRDDRSRLIAFGVHDSHRPYDGVEERVLSKDQQMTVTLNQPGDFKFHDHFDDTVEGTFTVH